MCHERHKPDAYEEKIDVESYTHKVPRSPAGMYTALMRGILLLCDLLDVSKSKLLPDFLHVVLFFIGHHTSRLHLPAHVIHDNLVQCRLSAILISSLL